MAGEGGIYSTHGMVKKDGTPFVATFVNDESFGQLTPKEAVALGIRAISAAIEAERDAGMIAYLKAEGFTTGAINVFIEGMRTYREQYDLPDGLGN
jgi:20S proteasome alpha/beta subunit